MWTMLVVRARSGGLPSGLRALAMSCIPQMQPQYRAWTVHAEPVLG